MKEVANPYKKIILNKLWEEWCDNDNRSPSFHEFLQEKYGLSFIKNPIDLGYKLLIIDEVKFALLLLSLENFE